MNIVNKLTLRQLKLNKRRTLVTILGVIISVAMVMAVTVSVSSMLNLLERVTISNDGSWHMRYRDMKAGDLGILEADENIDQIAVNYTVGFAALERPMKQSKPYLLVSSYNEDAFSLLPVTLLEGRVPENDREILIPEHLAGGEGLAYQIGDQITLALGQRYVADETRGERDGEDLTKGNSLVRDETGHSKEQLKVEKEEAYTIVGVMKKSKEEYSWSPFYELITSSKGSQIPAETSITAAVSLKELKGDIYTHHANLGSQLDVYMVEPNSQLLACYGATSGKGTMVALYGLVTIVLFIIMIGSVSLIYNAFAISVAERSQYLGMLASVGATRKQKRNSVFFEGLVIGGISIPLGLAAGCLGMWVTFGAINNVLKEVMSIEEDLRLVISLRGVLGAVALSLLTILIATYIPARRASKISAIEAIRQTADIKMNSKAIKTSKFTRKVFGIEGEIALKNLKRNGRRYRTTLLSLIVSIILFLSTSTFTAYMTRSMEMTIAHSKYDMDLYVPYLKGEDRADAFKTVRALDKVSQSQKINHFYLVYTYLEETLVPERVQALGGEGEEGYQYAVEILGLEDADFEVYAKEIGIELGDFIDVNKAPVILMNRCIVVDSETGTRKEQEILTEQVGAKVPLYSSNWNEALEDYTEEVVGEVTLSAFTKEPPMGLGISEQEGVLYMITSESILDHLLETIGEIQDYTPSGFEKLYLTSTDPMGLQSDIESLYGGEGANTYQIYNIYEAQKTMKQMQMVMKVFMYGFIVLITLVSVANIFNTISTSIALRKREFAMLRSMGMTTAGFNRMINFESIFYGLKALLYGLPLSFIIMVAMYKSLSGSLIFDFFIPVKSVIVVGISVFMIVGAAMCYSGAKVKDHNIIEGLKDHNL